METINPNLNHQHMIGTAYVDSPPVSVEIADQWLRELVEKLGMNVLIGPFTVSCHTEGNEGITGVVVLSTSHASFHCWHLVEKPFMTFDVYSCKAFEAKTVLDHLLQFETNRIEYVMLDRNEGVFQTERKVHIPPR